MEDTYFKRPEVIFIVFMFSILVLLSVLGNTMVMLIILRRRGMRTVTNYFLFNLSAGDLLSIFQIMPNVYYALTTDWIFGLAYCKLSQFFTAFNIAISVFTFIGITADRYMAIMFPLRPRSSRRTMIFFIILIWFSALIIGLPGLLFADVSSDVQNCSEARSTQTLTGILAAATNASIEEKCHLKRQCYYNWPERFSAFYDYALFGLMYVLPLITLAATYVPISIRLWFHGEIGEVTSLQMESVRAKRRAVKMMCTVMLIFAVCWLPYQLFFIVLRIQPSYYKYHNLKFIFIACYWLAMSNSVYNPIIYFTMNRKFRNGLFRTFPCLSRSKMVRRLTQQNRSKRTRVYTGNESRNRLPTLTDLDCAYAEDSLTNTRSPH